VGWIPEKTCPLGRLCRLKKRKRKDKIGYEERQTIIGETKDSIKVNVTKFGGTPTRKGTPYTVL